jgi:hypothetical protein
MAQKYCLAQDFSPRSRREAIEQRNVLLAHEQRSSLRNEDIGEKDKRGGHSSVGRAPALQAGGRRFDPVWLHQLSKDQCMTHEHRGAHG